MSKYVCTRWAFDLTTWTPTLQQLTQAIAAVQPEERLRLMRFHFIDDFLSSLIGRLLMRKFIAQNQSDLNYHDIKFARDIRGKPYWVRPQNGTTPNSNLCFNVSHQGDCVVLAGISKIGDGDDDDVDFGIGTDVMKIEYKGGRPLAEFFRLMESKFAAEEWANIKQADSIEDTQESLKAFMRHWCLKEAYVKELGVGITVDLKSICFKIDPSIPLKEDTSPVTSTTLRCSRVPMLNWHFEEHLIKPEHCAAIAFKNCKPQPEKFEFLDIKEVLVESEKAEENDIIEYCRQALQKAKKSWS